MFAQIESKMLAARRFNLLQKLAAIVQRVIRVRPGTSINKCHRLLLRIASQHGFAVCSTMKWKALSDRGKRDQALLSGNLIDEYRRPARHDGQVDGLTNLLAQRNQSRMQNLGEVCGERGGNSCETGAYTRAATGLRLNDEIFRRQRSEYSLDGGSRQVNLACNFRESKALRSLFQYAQYVRGASNHLDTAAA